MLAWWEKLEFLNVFWLAGKKVLLQASGERAVDGCSYNFSAVSSQSYRKFDLFGVFFQ